jgi:hypothetical protein
MSPLVQGNDLAQLARWCLTMAACWTMVSLSALAQPTPPPEDVFAELNRNAIEIYQDAKLRFGKSIDPVIIVGPDSVLIRRNGTERRVGRIPPAYTIMKTVGARRWTGWIPTASGAPTSR